MSLSIRSWIEVGMGAAIVLLLIALGFSNNAVGKLENKVGAVQNKVEALEAELNVSVEERVAAVESADNWKALATSVTKKLQDERAQVAKIREQNSAALAAAQASERDANNTLNLWMARYAAPKSATCAALLAQPLDLCPELLE
jgi:peptidoglycan hydrolase CwlO-like protein